MLWYLSLPSDKSHNKLIISYGISPCLWTSQNVSWQYAAVSLIAFREVRISWQYAAVSLLAFREVRISWQYAAVSLPALGQVKMLADNLLLYLSLLQRSQNKLIICCSISPCLWSKSKNKLIIGCGISPCLWTSHWISW